MNELNPVGGQIIINAINNSNTLIILNLSIISLNIDWTNIKDTGAKYLKFFLKKNTSLIKLNISNDVE